MTRTRMLGKLVQLTGAVLLLALAVPANATGKDHPCSNQSIAGAWLFATEVGQQKILPGGDITAIGTMNIDPEANVSGTFDATVAEFRFLPNVTYTGSVTVDSDCRGTLNFVTSAGTIRTDSIAVVSPNEMWGISTEYFESVDLSSKETLQVHSIPCCIAGTRRTVGRVRQRMNGTLHSAIPRCLLSLDSEGAGRPHPSLSLPKTRSR